MNKPKEAQYLEADAGIFVHPQLKSCLDDEDGKSITGLNTNNYVADYLKPEYNYKNVNKYENTEKGKLFLFSHAKYKDSYENPRYGTERDERTIIECFTRLGFECFPFVDKTANEIFEILKDATVDEDVGCFSVVIMTHGNLHKLCAKDKEFAEEEIYDILSENKSLAGKLKLIIIQACRNDKVEMPPARTASQLSLPPDTVLVHSTYPKRPSWRNPDAGTYLMQILCKRLNAMREPNDFFDEMLLVKRLVGQYTDGRQMVVVNHNLTKLYVIKPINVKE